MGERAAPQKGFVMAPSEAMHSCWLQRNCSYPIGCSLRVLPHRLQVFVVGPFAGSFFAVLAWLAVGPQWDTPAAAPFMVPDEGKEGAEQHA